MLQELLQNSVLLAAFLAWIITQLIKFIIESLRAHRLKWGALFMVGGMPSSHSASLAATTAAIGLFHGFGTPLFALSFVTFMIISYDAAGIRRQAGYQAARINSIINELLKGHPMSEFQLKEVLGYTPLQVFMGMGLGTFIGFMVWLITELSKATNP